MFQTNDGFENWFKNWDWMAIIYSLIGSALLVIILKLLGFFKWIKKKYLIKVGLRSYNKALIEICSALIVIGKRQSFSTQQVYIALDLATSDLMTNKPEDKITQNESFVLVGGPGAGKSTLAKKWILDRLDYKQKSLKFFVKLREYDPSKSIDEFLAEQLNQHKIPDPQIMVLRTLNDFRFLCILDGLDEVRPNLRDQVCNNINLFYNKYFKSGIGGQLIVTCRKEAYRNIPLDIPTIWEVRPLTDEQIQRYSKNWPLGYPVGKNHETFWNDLISTPRILELARSPLLLTGGLMQYTESNLGIPEERVEYLARIGKWLVSDWATAQGHPPDPYRSVYNRILPKLAYKMHMSQQPECSSSKAIQLIEEWLPDYGFEKNDAKNILESIMTKTGILVRGISSFVVFAQFGLQEYYASIESVDGLKPKNLATLLPKEWWREVILLAIAQQKEPALYLEELFLEDPILATLAVAECPTPSIFLQEKAISACLYEIDKENSAIRTSAVSLLRKLKGQLEEKFTNELEIRLSKTELISTTVGLILATADTISATTVLARHPAIWDTCLHATGFLSSNFENLLVDWIKTGDEKQSIHAIDLIAPRLSGDRFQQLVDLLPQLPAFKSDYLSFQLLRNLESDTINRHYVGYNKDFLKTISRCIPFIKRKDEFLKIIYSKKDSFYQKEDNIITISMFISKRDELLPLDKVYNYLLRCIEWSKYKLVLLSFLASAISILGFYFSSSDVLPNIFILISLFLIIIGFVMPKPIPPWSRYGYSYYPRPFVPISFLCIGFATIIAVIGYKLPSEIGPPNFLFNLILSSTFAILGFALLSIDNYMFEYFSITNYKINVINGIWFGLLLISIVLKFINLLLPEKWLIIFTIPYILWLIVYSFYLFLHWKKVRISRNEAEQAYIRIK